MTKKLKRPTMTQQVKQWKWLVDSYKGRLENLESTVKLLVENGLVSEDALIKTAKQQGMKFLHTYSLLKRGSAQKADAIWHSSNK